LNGNKPAIAAAISIVLALVNCASPALGRPVTMNEKIAEASLRRQGLHTIEDRYKEYQRKVERRLGPYFEAAGVPYPPTFLELIAVKDEKVLQVYASSTGPLRLIRSYSILAASGTAGPKLREGDRQVPEGVYGIEKLNPNSAYHLALRVAYPNQFDLDQAKTDGRTDLGNDIMIHGSDKSAGCLAMGNEAIEDLFILGDDVGASRIKLIITPTDFRKTNKLPADTKIYPWSDALYDHIKKDLIGLPE
jgi:hypothetical protein